jgi:site-specific recombinase XerD
MKDALRARVRGPLRPYVKGFVFALAEQGVAPGTAVLLVNLLAHLSRWMDGEGLGVEDLTPAVVERFMVERQALYTHHVTPRALRPLMGFLRGLGVAPPEPSPPAPSTALERLLDRYRRYLLGERGLSVEVVESRIRIAREFLAARDDGGELGLASLGSADVSGFVVAASRRWSRGQAKLTVVALRSLLRFLVLEGHVDPALPGAVPSVAGRRHSGIPRALEPGQVEVLLGGCDRGTATGRRDFAILMLLARLGLRRGEVARLQLGDVDWRAGEIRVHGKCGRFDRLPLPSGVGEAVADYLRDGRPVTVKPIRSVFLCDRAPDRAMSASAVGAVVARAAQRAGLEPPFRAHRLRHTVATEMLRAGAPLEEVGQLLRHRSSMSTAIYAKVDYSRLRLLALPWPACHAELDGQRLLGLARCWPGGVR